MGLCGSLRTVAVVLPLVGDVHVISPEFFAARVIAQPAALIPAACRVIYGLIVIVVKVVAVQSGRMLAGLLFLPSCFAGLRAKPSPAALAVGYAAHERAAAVRAFVDFGCYSHVISLSGGQGVTASQQVFGGKLADLWGSGGKQVVLSCVLK